MSILDRIARRLIKEELPAVKQAGSWFTTLGHDAEPEEVEYRTAEIALGDIVLTCQVADAPDMQTTGLQKHSELGAYEGMLFPYEKPRKVSFHMGSVKFPIDIVFVGSDGRVTKKVENVEPGSPGHWSMDHISAVVEANGGFCETHNIEVGTPFMEIKGKTAQQDNGFGTVDQGGQQYTVAEDMMEVDQGVMGGGIRYTVMFSPSQDVFWAEDSRAGHMIAGPSKSMQELQAQLGVRTAQEVFPRDPRKDLNPKMVPVNEDPNRFRDRDLVDQQVVNQEAPAYSETEGYDPISYHDRDDVAPTRMAAPGLCPVCGKDQQIGNHALCEKSVPLSQSDITREQYQKWDPQTQIVNDMNLEKGVEPSVMPDQNPPAPSDLGGQVPYGTDKRGEWFDLDKGHEFCVVDVTGIPEGGNMTYEVHLSVNRGGILVLDSPDGWGERCFWQEDGEDEPVDELSLNSIAKDLGDDVEMIGFNLILRYFNLIGIPEDIIGRWTSLEGVVATDGILVDHVANTHPGEPGFKEISRHVKPARSQP